MNPLIALGDVDVSCLTHMLEMITKGTLLSEYRRDPKRVTACIVASLGILMMAAAGFMHRKADEQDKGPLFGSAAKDDEFAENVLALGNALGVPHDAMGGSIRSELYALILDKFLDYLYAQKVKLIDLIKQYADEAHE